MMTRSKKNIEVLATASDPSPRAAQPHAGMLRTALLCATAALASSGLYDIEVEDLQSGLPVAMSFYQGKVLLIVNVASE